MSDLVPRLTEAATAAIANERPSLEHPVGYVRGVTVELTTGPGGGLADAVSCVERRKKIGRLGLLDHPKARVG